MGIIEMVEDTSLERIEIKKKVLFVMGVKSLDTSY